MPRRKTRLIPCYPAQAQFIDSQARFHAFKGGIGAGKSFIGAYNLFRRVEPGRLYMVCAPTYPILSQSTFRSFLHVAEMIGLAVKYHKQEKVATLENGTEILFRSAEEPEHLRGPNLSGIWLDEASLMAPEVYQIAIGRLREKNRMGWLAATFTPKGRGHWTYEVFGTGKPDTELIIARTIENPFNHPDFHATISAHYSDSFARQELDADWDSGDDNWQLIPTAWVQEAQARWMPIPPAGVPLTQLGADIARGGADSTVIAARYGLWIAPLRRYQGVETDSGEKAAQLILREHRDNARVNVDVVNVGASAYDALRSQIAELAVPINAGSKPFPVVWDRSRRYKLKNIRSSMYYLLREALDPQSGVGLALPPDPQLLADLTAWRFYPRGPFLEIEKKEDVAKRLGRSPDASDAVALAWYTGNGTGSVTVLDLGETPITKTGVESYVWPKDQRDQLW